MNIIPHCGTIALALLASSGCKSEKRNEQSTSPAESRSSRSGDRDEEAGTQPVREKIPSTSPKFAMNRNKETRELLGGSKPEWLSLAKAISAKVSEGRAGSFSWRELGASKTTFSAGAIVRTVGSVNIPHSLSSRSWSSAMASPDGSRLLMIPSEATESASLFNVTEGQLDEPSYKEIPVVNYDDSRRWFIEWQGWVSDSRIIGMINEDDPSGHSIVRTGIYLYDVDARELQRVELPTGVYAGGDPYLEIVSVSGNAIVVNTREGEKTITLKK